VTDSRVILDQAGAERLIGKGDMLLLDAGSSVPRRIQGAWVTEDEVRKVTAVWKRPAPDVPFDDSVQGTDDDAAGTSSGGGGGGGDDDDDLLWQAMELVVRSQLGSTSMLQRKLRVGFARAGRLMDLLEQRGVVGPSEGSKARAVLMTVEELDELIEGRGQSRAPQGASRRRRKPPPNAYDREGGRRVRSRSWTTRRIPLPAPRSPTPPPTAPDRCLRPERSTPPRCTAPATPPSSPSTASRSTS